MRCVYGVCGMCVVYTLCMVYKVCTVYVMDIVFIVCEVCVMGIWDGVSLYTMYISMHRIVLTDY